MKSVFKMTEDGFEQMIVEDDFVVEEPYTDVPPPIPNWKPIFDFVSKSWEERATEEEMNTSVEESSKEEILAQQISELEIKNIEKDILIESLGQQMSDLEILFLGGKDDE